MVISGHLGGVGNFEEDRLFGPFELSFPCLDGVFGLQARFLTRVMKEESRPDEGTEEMEELSERNGREDDAIFVLVTLFPWPFSLFFRSLSPTLRVGKPVWIAKRFPVSFCGMFDSPLKLRPEVGYTRLDARTGLEKLGLLQFLDKTP